MAAGEAPPQARLRPRLPAGRRREDEQDPAQPDRPRRPRRRLRRRRLPLPLPRGPALRPRRRLQLRGDGRPLQRRPRQQLRQPREPRAEHGGRTTVDGVDARRARGRSARGSSRRAAFDEPHATASTSSTSPAASARVWQLIRDANAYIEDRQPWALHKAGDADAVAAVLGDCLEALRIVALLASPVIPHAAAELWRRLGLAGAPEDQRLPDAAAWGSAATAGNTLEKGAALFPRIDAGRDRRLDRWVDSHCHLPDDRGRGRRDRSIGPGTAGSSGWSASGPTWPPRGPRSAVAERHDDVLATVGLHPHDASKLDDEWDELVELGRAPTGRRRSARPASTSTTTTRRPTPRRPRSAPRSGSPHERDRALVIHSREAWDDTFRVLDDEGVPAAHGLPLLHRRARRGAPRARPRHLPLVQRDRDVQDRGRPARPRPRRARSTGCWSRPTRRTSRRCRTGADRTSPRTSRSSAPASPPRAAGRAAEVAAATRATAAAVFGV